MDLEKCLSEYNSLSTLFKGMEKLFTQFDVLDEAAFDERYKQISDAYDGLTILLDRLPSYRKHLKGFKHDLLCSKQEAIKALKDAKIK